MQGMALFNLSVPFSTGWDPPSFMESASDQPGVAGRNVLWSDLIRKDRGSLVHPGEVELLHGAVITAEQVLAPARYHAGVTRQQQCPARCSLA